MGQASFRLDDDLEDWVESRLYPGQAKSAWYRYSIESTMQIDPILDDLFERHQYEKRQKFVENAVREAVEDRRKELGTSRNNS